MLLLEHKIVVLGLSNSLCEMVALELGIIFCSILQFISSDEINIDGVSSTLTSWLCMVMQHHTPQEYDFSQTIFNPK